MAQVTMNCKWRMQRSQQWDSYGKLLYLFLFWGKCFSLIYIYYCIYIYKLCIYIHIYIYMNPRNGFGRCFSKFSLNNLVEMPKKNTHFRATVRVFVGSIRGFAAPAWCMGTSMPSKPAAGSLWLAGLGCANGWSSGGWALPSGKLT